MPKGKEIASWQLQASNALGSIGCIFLQAREHAIEFYSDKFGYVYLATNKSKIVFAIDPVRFPAISLDGMKCVDGFNSNYAQFPSKMNTGNNEENFGSAFHCKDIEQLSKAIKELGQGRL